jgi:hypothetical protein
MSGSIGMKRRRAAGDGEVLLVGLFIMPIDSLVVFIS